MSKFLLIKIIGGFIAIAIVAGGISVWVKTHHSNVIVKEAEKILPARVNPLLKRSNEVYWFVSEIYYPMHIDDMNTHYTGCYYKGGYIPNADMKKQLMKDCDKTAIVISTYAHKQHFFTGSQPSDWTDQALMKKIFEEQSYFSKHFGDVTPVPTPAKYSEPDYIRKRSNNLQGEANRKFQETQTKSLQEHKKEESS